MCILQEGKYFVKKKRGPLRTPLRHHNHTRTSCSVDITAILLDVKHYLQHKKGARLTEPLRECHPMFREVGGLDISKLL